MIRKFWFGVLILTALMVFAVMAGCDRKAHETSGEKIEEKTASEEPKVIERKSKRVKLETSLGDIVVELDGEAAPVTVKNFLRYVDEGFFDGTIFHRVIKGFMIQGGGFTADMRQKKTHAPIVNEAGNGLKNNRGTIAMARTQNPNSATSQFFITGEEWPLPTGCCEAARR